MLKKHSCFTPPNSYSTQRRALRNISIRGESSPRRIGKTDRKINPGPPAQRFMKPPLSRYIALAQRRTMALMSRRGPLLEKKDRADTALALRDQDRTERALAHGEANRGVRATGAVVLGAH